MDPNLKGSGPRICISTRQFLGNSYAETVWGISLHFKNSKAVQDRIILLSLKSQRLCYDTEAQRDLSVMLIFYKIISSKVNK